MGLWASHRDLVESFTVSSIFEKTLALDTWDNTEEVEEDPPKHSVDSDNRYIDGL